MDLAALRTGIAAAVSAVTSTWELECKAYVPDSIDPPVAFVRPGVVKFDATFARGTDDLGLDVFLLVSRVEDRDAQEFLDSFLAGGGPASVKTAIEAGNGAPGEFALGGACDFVHVPTAEAYQWYVVGGVEYLGARWAVRCIGTGAS